MYLKRVSISNFRIFPPGFSLELEGPGVTILVGQNGLGKSSFFEAVEWALTGKVERLLSLPSGDTANAKQRETVYAWITEGKVSDHIDVELEFDDFGNQRRLRRRWEMDRNKRGFQRTNEPSEADVLSLLNDEKWSLSVTDVGSYLHQTHILSQSEQARFIARDPKERWNGLVGPIGFERLSRAQRALTGGTTRALSLKYSEQEESLRQAENNHNTWLQFLSERDTSRQRIALAGGISEELIRTELAKMRADIIDALAVVGVGAAAAPQGSNLGDVEEALALLESKLVQTSDALERVREAPKELSEINERIEESQRQFYAANAEQDIFLRRRVELQNKIDDTGARVASAQVRAEAARAQWTLIRKVASSLPNLESVLGELNSATTDVEALKARRAELAAKLDGARGLLRVVERQVSTRGEAEARIGELRSLMQGILQLQAASANLPIYVSQLQEAQHQLSSLDERAQDARDDIENCKVRIRSIEAEKAAIQDKLGVIERAVAEIAAIIGDDQQTCPVCGTQFAESGELSTRVRHRAHLGDAALARLEENATQALAHMTHLNSVLDDLQEQRAKVEATYMRLKTAIAEVDQQHNKLRMAPDLVGVGPDRWHDATVAAISHVELIISQNLPTDDLSESRRRVDDAFKALQALDEDITAAETRQAALAMRRAELELTLQENERIVAQLRADAGATLLSEAAQSSTEAQDEAEQAQSVLEALRAERKLVDEQIRDHDARVKRAKAAVDSATSEGSARAASVQARWGAAGCRGPVSADAVVKRAEQLSSVSGILSGLRQRRKQVREWAEIIKGMQENEATEVRIKRTVAEYGQQDEEGVSQLLATRVATERRLLERIGRARDSANQLAESLRGATENYVRETLEPLNELSDRFHQAFSTFPERRVTMDPRTDNKQGTSLRAHVRLHRGSSDDDALPARHILSEGQLSETSLSLLFAMSTGCRWSRWRGLLLDDPLQHNDIVHGAAFIDVVRNMVVDPSQAYQFVISTHDLDLAEFFQRKLTTGKVPCVIYRYVRPGSVERFER